LAARSVPKVHSLQGRGRGRGRMGGEGRGGGGKVVYYIYND